MHALALDHIGLPIPATGWPGWVADAPYVGEAHPLGTRLGPIGSGANCQRYAYELVAMFGRAVPAVRSSELWALDLQHPAREEVRPLDLALFNDTEQAWGAHVAVVTATGLLHLCSEVGRPAL